MTTTYPYKMQPGYAETSTRKYPVNPETVIVSQTDCDKVVCQGAHYLDGRLDWLRFKVKGEKRYYFQLRHATI